MSANVGSHTSVILSYDREKGGKPSDFSCNFVDPIVIKPTDKVALYSIELERDLVVLDEDVDRIITDTAAGDVRSRKPGFVFNVPGSDISYNIDSTTDSNNPKKILVELEPGSNYTKTEFLNMMLDKTQTAINDYNVTSNLDLQYQPRIIDNGANSFFGLTSIYRKQPVRLSGLNANSSVNMTSRNIDNSVNIFATDINPNFRPTANATISASDWGTYGFGSSAINVFGNHGSTTRNSAEVENTSMAFNIVHPNTEYGEYFVGFLSETYRAANWATPDKPDAWNVKVPAGTTAPTYLKVPKCYFGCHFEIANDVDTTSNASGPYTRVTIVGCPQPNHIGTVVNGATNKLDIVKRVSTTSLGTDPCVLYRTTLYNGSKSNTSPPGADAFSDIYQNPFWFNIYYRYTTESRDITRARFYFQFGTNAIIGGKSVQNTLFDSKDCQYSLSYRLMQQSYQLFNPASPADLATANIQDGLPGGMVPFWACNNVLGNFPLSGTQVYYGWNIQANINRLGTSRYYNRPLGIYSYRIDEITPQLQRILGAKEFQHLIGNRRTDIDAELGIVQFYQENKRYNVIIKSLPLNVNMSTKGGNIGAKQNVIFKITNQFNREITNAGNRSITSSIYPPVLKTISLDNTSDLVMNQISVEIRDADTNKIAKEILDTSLELVIVSS